MSLPMGERNAERLYHLSTDETLRLLVTEEYGTAMAQTRLVVAGWSLRHMAGSSAPLRVAILSAAPRRPPSPPPPHYGAGCSSSAQLLHGVDSGCSASPPFVSAPQSYAPEEDPSHGYDHGNGARSGYW